MSTNHFIAFGSWRLRHEEPLGPWDKVVRLFPLPEDIDLTRRSIIRDWSNLPTTHGYLVLETDQLDPLGSSASGNLDAHRIPLAIVERLPNGWRLHHMLMRVDMDLAHLIRIADSRQYDGCLWEQIERTFSANHVELNNWECFYIKGVMTDIELEQKYEIDQSYHYYTLCRDWWRTLDNGELAGFVPQLGDELQHWSYDNYFFEIEPNAKDDRGYVSVMQYAKRKHQWDDPMYTFKKKLFAKDALERYERNYENETLRGDPRAALSAFFDYPLRELPQWRRTRVDTACEASTSGNLFMVNFEDCRIHDASLPAGRLQQCEIEYLKTRGVPNRDSIYEDLDRLRDHVERFLTSHGLTFRRTNYSKLSFLRDYVARQQGV